MDFLKKLLPIIFLPVFSSCQEVFTPDVSATPVLCINSMITAGEPIETVVSKSRVFTESRDKSEVKDATIRLFANGFRVQDSYIPREGDNIRIEAESPSVGSGEAEVRVPSAIPIPEATWEVSNVHCWLSEEDNEVCIRFKLKVRLTISDPEGINYYDFNYKNHSVLDDEEELSESSDYNYYLRQVLTEMEPVFNEHIELFNSIMGGESSGTTFFTDRQFEGEAYTLHIYFDDCWFQYPVGVIPKCTTDLIVSSISPSFYFWQNYLWQRDSGTLTELSDFGLGDPVWGYSNVSTGAGVVAAQSRSVCTIDLTEFFSHTLEETFK